MTFAEKYKLVGKGTPIKISERLKNHIEYLNLQCKRYHESCKQFAKTCTQRYGK